jgi:hypothetical protein
MQRLVAEWLAERARLVGSLIGLTDEQFNSETAPNQWTYRVVAKHVLKLEQNSLNPITADRAARTNHGRTRSLCAVGVNNINASCRRGARPHRRIHGPIQNATEIGVAIQSMTRCRRPPAPARCAK